MVVSDGSVLYGYKDIYPTYNGGETSTEAVPDADDMAALNENEEDAKNNSKQARGKNMIFACIVLIALVVWFGGAK